MLNPDRYARSTLLPLTLTVPTPCETDHDQGDPTTVHHPPVSEFPQPLALTRWKLSETIPPAPIDLRIAEELSETFIACADWRGMREPATSIVLAISMKRLTKHGRNFLNIVLSPFLKLVLNKGNRIAIALK